MRNFPEKCGSVFRRVRGLIVRDSFLLLIFFCFFLAGCADAYTRNAVSHANRNFPGHFRGEYFAAFSREGTLLSESCATWYNQPPSSGPRTPLDRIPPTRIRSGMTVSQVKAILGEPDGLGHRPGATPTAVAIRTRKDSRDPANSRWWRYEIR